MSARKPPSPVKRIPPRRVETSLRAERWWKQTGADLAHNVAAVVDEIEKRQSTRRGLWARYLGLYLDLRLGRGGGWSNVWRCLPSSEKPKRCTYNVVQANIDTAGAHLNRQRPRPLYLTSDGDYALQLQAKKLTRYMDGLFAAINIHKVGQLVARDSRIFGTGIGYFYADLRRDPDETEKVIGGEIKVERVMIDELFVDDEEARYGVPRQMFRKRQMSKDELADLFPEHAAEIDTAAPARDTRANSDLIEVCESWHLPTGCVRWRAEDGTKSDKRSKGAEAITDGLYAITIDGVTLHQRPYVYDYFPFLPLHWTDPAAGFWGRGIAEELQGIQQAITNERKDIDAGMKSLGKTIIFVQEGSSVPDITDEIAQVVPYIGERPTAATLSPFAPEVFQVLQSDYQMSFELTGVSHANATGQKPAGVDAAVAIREVNDTASARFVDKAQAYEKWFIDAARICIDLAREMFLEHEVDLVVKGRAQKFIESIKWSDVNLDDDKYDMQTFPVSLLPTTPQGRLQTATDMLDKGAINQQQWARLVEMPDLEAYPSIETAAFDYACGIVADILEGGEYPGLDTRAPLSFIRDVALANYLRALREKVPEAILERLRQLMDEATDYMAMLDAGMDPSNPQDLQAFIANGRKPPPPPAPPMPPGGPMPGGPPMPPGAPPLVPPTDEQPPIAA